MRTRVLKSNVSSALLLVSALSLALSGCVGGAPPPNADVPAPRAEPPTEVRDYYPDKARQLGLTGRVALEYSCDERGRPQNIIVVESAGSLLDDAAKYL